MGEWEIVSLGELCDFRAGSVFKPAFQGQSSGEFPFVKVSDMDLPANAVRIQDANNWVSAVDLLELQAKVLPPGTVVFAKIGEALRQNRLRQVVRETVIDNNMMGAVPRINRVDPRFFYYALSRFDFSDIAQGTALPYLTVGSLLTLTLDLPPLPEQRAIAHILGTLDDKIELNRRRNQTLEAMARALFQDWFVDFGPVRAKMEGQEPYLPADLWQLFPDRLDDEGKPEGWTIAALDTLAALVTTSVSPGKSPETVFEHYSIPAYDAGRMPAMELGASIKSNKYVVDANAVLVSKLNPQTPRIWLPAVATMHAICSTEFMQFVPHDRRNRPYLYCLMSSEAMQGEVLKHVTGSTGSRQRAQPSQIAKVDILKPHADILKAFNLQAAPILNAAADNQRESRTLAQLRDTLLPKLISGELRIADAEKFIEAAQ
jgi:type I restriction enzyme S subunit